MTAFFENQSLLSGIVPRIIAWYDENRVDLPWRREPTPYHVWISEIMLQQTRIDAVLSYYARFLEELPTLESLASVEEERLLKLWQGLGYYSRAKNLKKAATVVMEKYEGVLPSTASELEKLPGIGSYTAGAIASIAYGKPSPAVDGNVLRVLSRMLLSYDDIMQPRVKNELTEILKRYYPEGKDAALLTEGLMELGERVCIPNGEPRCESCPVREICLAKRHGVVDALPVRIVKKDKRLDEKTVLVLRSPSGRYAIRKRDKSGLLADMWELVNFDGFGADGDVESYLAEKGIGVSSIRELPEAKHVFTHVIWQMKGYFVDVTCESNEFVWKSKEEIAAEYAIPTAFKAYIKEIKE